MVSNNISWVVGGAVSAPLSAGSPPELEPKNTDENEKILTSENAKDKNIIDQFKVGSVYKFGKYRDCLVLSKGDTSITIQGVNNKKVREIDFSELCNYI